MKNKSILVAIAAAFFAFACENQENRMAEETQTTTEQPTNETESQEGLFKMTPEEFTQKAYEANLKEVQMAELAAKKSTDSEVKSFCTNCNERA